MMTLPFAGLLIGLVLAWAGWRIPAITLWALSLAAMLVLFRMHVTSALPLSF